MRVRKLKERKGKKQKAKKKKGEKKERKRSFEEVYLFIQKEKIRMTLIDHSQQLYSI